MNRIRRNRPRNQRRVAGSAELAGKSLASSIPSASTKIGRHTDSGGYAVRLQATTPAAFRSRERTLAREAALRDKRDAVANHPIDRAEARARILGGSAWTRHRVLKGRASNAVRGGATAVDMTTAHASPTTVDAKFVPSSAPSGDAPLPHYSRADRAVVSLLLVPLLFFAMGVSAMKSLNATAAKPVAATTASVTQLAMPVTHPAMAATLDRVADDADGRPVPPLPKDAALTVTALSATPPDVLPTVPAQDLAAVDASTTLIPAITQESELYSGRDRRCAIEEEPVAPGLALLAALARSDSSAADFGQALAEAAQQQLGEFVVYTDSYKRLSFPMGDVPSLFGVCTDVVIRAYRVVGVDLQRLVHRARVGSGDPNIDHRRTEVLRRFFAANGRSLPVTDVADDYLPGDIVTYHRPQNKGSQSHIAIVSNVKGASGRPLVVHNRGWGPQLEDALFVDEITGHYRYRGRPEAIAAGLQPLRRAAPLAKSVSRSLTWSRKTMISRAKARITNRAAVRQSGPERARSVKPVSGS